jgi:hypothetical protein
MYFTGRLCDCFILMCYKRVEFEIPRMYMTLTSKQFNHLFIGGTGVTFVLSRNWRSTLLRATNSLADLCGIHSTQMIQHHINAEAHQNGRY